MTWQNWLCLIVGIPVGWWLTNLVWQAIDRKHMRDSIREATAMMQRIQPGWHPGWKPNCECRRCSGKKP